MFPLGSVLFPHMPLPLRLFESRYLVMLGHLLEQNDPSFGVVLIERGQEVGGGEQRFGVGTMAQIIEVDARKDFVSVVARGTDRFRVVGWEADGPYPRATLAPLPELHWNSGLEPARNEAESQVRRALAAMEEVGGTVWPADVALATDPMIATWQLAGLAPIGAMDQLSLLQVETTADLLAAISRLSREVTDIMSLRRSESGE